MKDPCIRQLLIKTELSKYISDDSSKIVEEMNIPAAKARIDMAVINGHLHGFEIKSASDTLKRLPNQIEAYTKVFDYLTIVTEEKYHDRILKIIPDWIGVQVCIEKKGVQQIKRIRKASLNHQQVGFYLAKLLWRDELISVLSDMKISFKKSERNWLLCETLAQNVNTPELSKIVRGILKKRVDWKNDFTEGCEAM